MNEKIHIGLIEDQLLFREGMKAILSGWPELEVVFESPDGFSVMERLKKTSPLPDVLLVDLSLPPDGDKEFGGAQVTDAVRTEYPDIKIVILSIHQDERFIAHLIEHGAHGYLVKDCDPEEVREAVLSVHRKGSYINERTLRAIQNNIGKKNRPAQASSSSIYFTKRELEILQLICKQFTSEEIGEKLFISEKTVNGHRNNLLQKTNSRNVAGLVVYALTHNLVEDLEG